jgi:hypothetical protein
MKLRRDGGCGLMQALSACQTTKRTASTLLKTEGFVFLDLTLEVTLEPSRLIAAGPGAHSFLIETR